MARRLFPMLLIAFASITVNATGKPSFGPDASQFMGGDEGDACTMIMCLSNPAGQDMSECAAALRKYAEMDPDDRPGFLEKCPMVTGGGDT